MIVRFRIKNMTCMSIGKVLDRNKEALWPEAQPRLFQGTGGATTSAVACTKGAGAIGMCAVAANADGNGKGPCNASGDERAQWQKMDKAVKARATAKQGASKARFYPVARGEFPPPCQC